jgi:addiction module HigA family antidote
MTPLQPFRDRPPAHFGAVLREDVLPDLGLSVADVAERLGISWQTLHGLLRERHAVTAELVVARFDRLLGCDSALRLRMQQARDLWLVQRDQVAVARIRAGLSPCVGCDRRRARRKPASSPGGKQPATAREGTKISHVGVQRTLAVIEWRAT